MFGGNSADSGCGFGGKFCTVAAASAASLGTKIFDLKKKAESGKILLTIGAASCIIIKLFLMTAFIEETVVTWSSIEVVITSTTGNRVAANTARGFESLLLRQKRHTFRCVSFLSYKVFPQAV